MKQAVARASATSLSERLRELRAQAKLLEAQRLEQRTLVRPRVARGNGLLPRHRELLAAPDRPRARRAAADALSYFPSDFLLVIDESHVTVPQIGGMYRGDRSRKETLVEFGFRLPSALDNRPLNFAEFEAMRQPGDLRLRHPRAI